MVGSLVFTTLVQFVNLGKKEEKNNCKCDRSLSLCVLVMIMAALIAEI